ncbi:hypothetical protein SDC9_209249 [bioreactor metagenome]|uniref:Uncharacterized protein n=1 Tax=bioreactor metagenome TaxID=1076179 RepID=A0A645JCW8_9ZZZZ
MACAKIAPGSWPRALGRIWIKSVISVMKNKVIAYEGIFAEKGKTIEAGEALGYVMERCGIQKMPDMPENNDFEEFSHMVVDWYFSGNWIEVREFDDA